VILDRTANDKVDCTEKENDSADQELSAPGGNVGDGRDREEGGGGVGGWYGRRRSSGGPAGHVDRELVLGWSGLYHTIVDVWV
jgi:hypothetical protein